MVFMLMEGGQLGGVYDDDRRGGSRRIGRGPLEKESIGQSEPRIGDAKQRLTKRSKNTASALPVMTQICQTSRTQ